MPKRLFLSVHNIRSLEHKPGRRALTVVHAVLTWVIQSSEFRWEELESAGNTHHVLSISARICHN